MLPRPYPAIARSCRQDRPIVVFTEARARPATRTNGDQPRTSIHILSWTCMFYRREGVRRRRGEPGKIEYPSVLDSMRIGARQSGVPARGRTVQQRHIRRSIPGSRRARYATGLMDMNHKERTSRTSPRSLRRSPRNAWAREGRDTSLVEL